MKLLEKRKVLITGGTSGIGKAIAILFASHGADIAIVGTNPEKAKEALKEIEAAKDAPEQEILSFMVDVSKTDKVSELVDNLLKKWGKIEILVNNAGITRDTLLMKMTEKEWDEVIDVNLKSTFNTSKAVIRSMLSEKYGKIINISSVIGLVGAIGQTNYAASKAGVIGFTKALAEEVARKNICVNCIAPGYIQTPMTEVLPDAIKNSILERIPMKRFGNPIDIANIALFFASHLSNYVTGQVLTGDGGLVR
jgi:3-oxoacyl-[acyl-carrier protein] reductase